MEWRRSQRLLVAHIVASLEPERERSWGHTAVRGCDLWQPKISSKIVQDIKAGIHNCAELSRMWNALYAHIGFLCCHICTGPRVPMLPHMCWKAGSQPSTSAVIMSPPSSILSTQTAVVEIASSPVKPDTKLWMFPELGLYKTDKERLESSDGSRTTSLVQFKF